MSGPFKLVSLPPSTVPFLLKRRRLPDWVRLALAEAVHQFPEELRVASNLENIQQELEPVLDRHCAEELRAWLLDDILLCADWVCSFTGRHSVSVRLEKLNNRACPKFHVDVVSVRLLCTYCGPGTEWTDANTAYSINFEEEFDEANVHQIPSEAIVMYGGSKTAYGMTPLWHRSPEVPDGTERLLLCIEPISCGC